jgi:hypothetical protein
MLKISRRNVQIVLGILWLIDGCLQLQTKMFTSNFVSQVIQPAQAGQPFYIYDPIHLAVRVFLTHPAVFNSLIAITQAGIGLLILYRPTTKYGLWLSVLWGVFVWYFGEAAAGMFSAQSSLLLGLPGAALLYSVISLGVLPKAKKLVVDYWLAYVWVLIWAVGAVFQLLPAQNTVSNLKMMISNNAAGAPAWMASLDNRLADSLNHVGASAHMSSSMMMSNMPSGYLFIFALALLQLAIGLGVLFGKRLRAISIVCGILLSLAFWVVGQQLGGYFTGVMTDVGTAPLIVLLGLAIYSQPDIGLRLKNVYSRIEKALV